MKHIRKILSIVAVLAIILIGQFVDAGFVSAVTTCPAGYTKNSNGICVKTNSKVLGSGGGNPAGEDWDVYLTDSFIGTLSHTFSSSSLNLNNQTFDLGGLQLTNSGLLFGGGTIKANLINSGVMFLGNDLFSIQGDFSNVGGTMNEVIGSEGEHGILNVSGDVFLGGALNISLADGFTPQVGQQFLLIDIPHSISGSYDSITPGWTTKNINGDIYLTSTSVPEPSTMLLVGIGLLGLAGFGVRRRKKGETK
jgi:hypothetical protein